jgi:DNA-binding transcriptional MerR regulator
MSNDEYTLEELAQLLDLQPRTIRSYIQQGLLRGPDSRGRHARYGEYHLKRLRKIKELKEVQGMKLDEIRRTLTVAGPEEDDPSPPRMGQETRKEEASAPMEGPSTALEFVRARKALARGGGQPTTSKPTGEEPPSVSLLKKVLPSTPLERLLKQLQRVMTDANVTRKARGEEWVRLQVTPDIEIHVRGHLSQEQLHGFEQLADLMRHILLGSEEHE